MARAKYQVVMVNNEVLQVEADYVSHCEGVVVFGLDESIDGDETTCEPVKLVANGQWKYVTKLDQEEPGSGKTT